jgi:lysophospholipase L1-like esterase
MKRLIGIYAKQVLFSLVITVLFFAALEAAWRVGMSVATRKAGHLLYGNDVLKMRLGILAGRAAGSAGAPRDGIGTDDTTLILTLGGSTTKCTPYVSEAHSWPRRLEYYLNETDSLRNVSVRNLAQQGNLLKRNLKEYEAYRKDHPGVRAALFYMGINDALAISLAEDDAQRIRPSFPARLDARIASVSLFYATITGARWKIAGGNDTGSRTGVVYGDVTARGLRKFRERVGVLAALARVYPTRIILCSVPVSRSYLSHHPEVASLYEEIVVIMREEARAGGIAFLDVNGRMYEEYPDFGDYFIDGVHINKEGNDIVARLIAQYIASLKIV